MTGEERGRISMDLWKKDLLETPIETIDIEAEAACKRHMDGKLDGKGIWIINQANVDALYGIIEICSKKIITPIMITTPYLSEYSNKIQNEFPSFFD